MLLRTMDESLNRKSLSATYFILDLKRIKNHNKIYIENRLYVKHYTIDVFVFFLLIILFYWSLTAVED